MENYYGETPAAWLPQPPTPRRRGRKWFLIGGMALALALTLGVGALVGSALGSTPASAASNTGQASQSPAGSFQGFAPRGPADNGQQFAATPGPGGQGPCVTLTVTAISGSTITAKAQDGSTVTIHTTSSTTYTQNHQAATASALKVGSVISVMGTRNSDGSITATSIDVLG